MEYDPIDVAEKLTGKRSGDSLNDLTTALGFMGHLDKNKALKELLSAQDDTSYSSSWEDFKRIAESEGFEQILVDINSEEDELIISWNNGILLCAESYSKTSINTAKLYYFLEVEKDSQRKIPKTTGGGSFCWFNYDEVTESGICELSKDIREGFRHHMNQVRDCGKTLELWPKQPFLWLLSYMDTKDKNYDYKKINIERIGRLPEGVKKAICG